MKSPNMLVAKFPFNIVLRFKTEIRDNEASYVQTVYGVDLEQAIDKIKRYYRQFDIEIEITNASVNGNAILF